jgi:hypothetical protein
LTQIAGFAGFKAQGLQGLKLLFIQGTIASTSSLQGWAWEPGSDKDTGMTSCHVKYILQHVQISDLIKSPTGHTSSKERDKRVSK